MRIKNIAMTNFRCHQSFACEFDRLNFLVGENAVGKSSIALAIEFALTGRAAGVTDQGGKGADDLITAGKGAMRVDLTLQRGKETAFLRRTKTPRTHELEFGDGIIGPLADMQRKLYHDCGVTADVLSACLNSGRFLSMDEKSQKALLAQVLASESPKIPDSIRSDVNSLSSVQIAPLLFGDGLTVQGIDDLYKTFYSMRTDTNRDLKALGTLAEPQIPEDTPSYETVKAKLDGVRKELAALTNQQAREQQRHKDVIEANEAKRKAIALRKAEAESAMLTEAEAEKLETIAACADKTQKLSDKIQSLDAKIAVKKSEIDQARSLEAGQLREQINELSRQIAIRETMIATIVGIKGAECPTCQRKLTAKEKAEIGQHLDAEIEAFNAKAPDLAGKLQEAISKVYPEEIEKLIAQRVTLEGEFLALGDVAGAQQKMRQHREAIVEVGRCDRELAAVIDPNPPASDLAEKIEAVNERIARGEEVLKTIGDIEREVKAFKEWKAKKESLEAKLVVLERLIDYFGPNGIKATMVGDKIGPFVQQMNAALEPFGYAIRFSLEPYEFQVSSEIGGQITSRKLSQLSRSESWRFGVAFQLALAKATGVNFAVIDEADILFGDNRASFVAMVLECQLDQVIVLYSGAKPAQKIEDIKFIELFAKEKAAAA